MTTQAYASLLINNTVLDANMKPQAMVIPSRDEMAIEICANAPAHINRDELINNIDDMYAKADAAYLTGTWAEENPTKDPNTSRYVLVVIVDIDGLSTQHNMLNAIAA